MGIAAIIDKAKYHIAHIAVNKSPTFAFYRLLELANRRIRLPSSVFTYNITQVFAEKYLEEHIHPNDSGVFIDIGANIGYWTMLAIKRGFKEIHAFEPSPRPLQILKKRTKRYTNVDIHAIALGDAPGIAPMKLYKSFSPHATMGCLADEPQRGEIGLLGIIKVPVRTLDSYKFQDIDLIKIDTEGYEVPILLGAKETILRCAPRLIVEAHSPYSREIRRIIKVLRKLDYSYKVGHKTLLGCTDPQPHVFGYPGQRGTESVWAQCRCGFGIRYNDLERFDGLCPICKLDWYIYGFDGTKKQPAT